jgi:hypothetical protein
MLLLLCSYQSKTQNAFGFSIGYGQIKPAEWNKFLDFYNSGDTVISKHPNLKHVPCASLIYERQIADYFYVQGQLNFNYTSTSSKQNGDLKWEIMGFGANLAVNFYPFKLIKGTSKTALNPLLIQVACGANYYQKTLTLNGTNVIAPETSGFSSKNIAVVAGCGLGYDLHFGKRIVLQTVFDFKYINAIDMPELSYFVKDYEIKGLSTTTSATIIGGKVSLLFLFKGLGGGRKNNINSKKSMFS